MNGFRLESLRQDHEPIPPGSQVDDDPLFLFPFHSLPQPEHLVARRDETCGDGPMAGRLDFHLSWKIHTLPDGRLQILEVLISDRTPGQPQVESV